MDTRGRNLSQVSCMKRRRCGVTSSDVDFLKRRKYTTTSEAVLNDEDLLALILLRAPYIQLVSSLMSVSRKWRCLITAPHFTRLLRTSLPPLRASGLFIQPPFFLRSRVDEVYFVSLDNPNTPSPFRTNAFAHDPFDPEKVVIIQSCNGLLLCSNYHYAPEELQAYYVYNPSTNHLHTLPDHPPGSGPWVLFVGLAFDLSKSIHYKLITFDDTSISSSRVGDFYIYSSETGTWRRSVESFSPPPGMDFTGGVYWNGRMHWLRKMNSNPEAESTCLCFNVDNERFETFPGPPTGVKNSLYFGESEGHLHFVEACPCATSLSVYEMKSDYSGWSVKYQVDLDPISKLFPEMTNHITLFHDKNDYAFAVLSLVRRENFREDPFLVLELPGKVIRYNLVTGSVKMMWDFSVHFSPEDIDDWTCGNFQVWPYIESV